jgi:hypothetical protein
MSPRELPFPCARRPALIGMVHVPALPGTLRNRLSAPAIVDQAVAEAHILADSGYDAAIIENMHDVPYLRRDVGPEVVATMTAIACAVRASTSLPLGIQILAGANRAAIAVAQASGATFIRAEGFVFASVADEGILDEADAGPLFRYRRQIAAEGVKVLCDIRKKHSAHSLTADVTLEDWARAATFFGADGLVVTGRQTGDPVRIQDAQGVRNVSTLPVLIGSGVTPENLASLAPFTDAFIVGTWIKHGGRWDEPVAADRAKALVGSLRSIQRES